MVRRLSVFISVATLCLFATLPSVAAGDFRVRSSLYADAQPEPGGTNLTIFSGGKVYDFRYEGRAKSASEITLFDPTTGQFELLDAATKQRTVINQRDLKMFTARLKAEAVDPSKQHLDFLINPDMTVNYEPSTREITISCEKLTYSAKGVTPQDATAVAAYRTYADWVAQLNTTRGHKPPFVRLRLNHELATRDLIPDTIQLSILVQAKGKAKRVTLRSDHDTSWALTSEDTQRIQRAKKMLAEFQLVDFQKYIRAPDSSGQ